jgi:hypothetical protein
MLFWGPLSRGAKKPVEGISQTILELTRAQLVDAGREGELAELLTARDPVRLVTSRSLFRAAPLALVSLEAPSLADHVYRGSRWIDSRGASMILEEFARGTGSGSLTAALAPFALPAGALVYAQPGSALIVCDSARAKDVARAVASAFLAATGAHAHVAAEELWPDEALLGRSPDLVRPPRFGVLADALRASVEASLDATPSGLAYVPGFIARCGACRVAPASVAADATNAEAVCAACHARRERARTQTEVASQHLEQAIELTETERERHEEQAGHVALIAASVEGVAPLIAGLGGVDQVAMTRTAIASALDTAISELIEKLGLRRRWQRHAAAPGEVALLVPASRALDGIRRLVEGVEAGLTREADALSGYPEIQEALRKMRLAVGACFAPSTYAPALVAAMAQSLRASARRTALRHALGQSAVDFWVLADGAPHSSAVDELRHHAYESRRDVRLTRRPYAYPEFKRDVLDALRPFRRLPRPEVVEIRRQLASDPRAADLNLRYQVARSDEWRQFATEVAGKDPARWEALLFRTTADGARETGFLDLAELADFHD